MKNTFLLLFLLFSNTVLAQPKISVGGASKESFVVTEVKGDPLSLSIQKIRDNEAQLLTFDSTVAQHQKMTIATTQNGRTVELEILVVLLPVEEKAQSIQIFIPVKPEFLKIKGKLSPVCELRNEGSFSWGDDPQQLLRKIQLTKSNVGKNHLKVLIGEYKAGKVVSHLEDCFTFEEL